MEITLGIETYNGTVIVRLESKDGTITEIPTNLNPAFVLAMQGLHPVSPRVDWPRGGDNLLSNYPDVARQWHPTRNEDKKTELPDDAVENEANARLLASARQAWQRAYQRRGLSYPG